VVKFDFLQSKVVKNTVLQIHETSVNESFDSVNDIFGGFGIFLIDLYFKIMD